MDGWIQLSQLFQKLSRCAAAAGAAGHVLYALSRQPVAVSLRKSLAPTSQAPSTPVPACCCCLYLASTLTREIAPHPTKFLSRCSPQGEVRPRASDPAFKDENANASHTSRKRDVLVVRLLGPHIRAFSALGTSSHAKARENDGVAGGSAACSSMTCACA